MKYWEYVTAILKINVLCSKIELFYFDRINWTLNRLNFYDNKQMVRLISFSKKSRHYYYHHISSVKSFLILKYYQFYTFWIVWYQFSFFSSELIEVAISVASFMSHVIVVFQWMCDKNGEFTLNEPLSPKWIEFRWKRLFCLSL